MTALFGNDYTIHTECNRTNHRPRQCTNVPSHTTLLRSSVTVTQELSVDVIYKIFKDLNCASRMVISISRLVSVQTASSPKHIEKINEATSLRHCIQIVLTSSLFLRPPRCKSLLQPTGARTSNRNKPLTAST